MTAYPLQAARDLRTAAVEEAQAKLRQALEAEARAHGHLESARRTLDAHEEATRTYHRSESQRRGGSVAAFQRAQAYADRRRSEALALRQALTEATEQHAEAKANVSAAQEHLGAARAEREAIERHHERWVAERRKQQQRKEEEAAEDLIQARWKPS